MAAGAGAASVALLKAFEVGPSEVLPPARLYFLKKKKIRTNKWGPHVQIPKTAGDILIKNHTLCIFLNFESVYPKPRAGWFGFGGVVYFVPTGLAQGSCSQMYSMNVCCDNIYNTINDLYFLNQIKL